LSKTVSLQDVGRTVTSDGVISADTVVRPTEIRTPVGLSGIDRRFIARDGCRRRSPSSLSGDTIAAWQGAAGYFESYRL